MGLVIFPLKFWLLLEKSFTEGCQYQFVQLCSNTRRARSLRFLEHVYWVIIWNAIFFDFWIRSLFFANLAPKYCLKFWSRLPTKQLFIYVFENEIEKSKKIALHITLLIERYWKPEVSIYNSAWAKLHKP